MTNIIAQQVQKLGKMFASCELDWSTYSPRQKYALIYAYYECLHANDSALHNLADGNVSTKNATSGIAGIFEDSETDSYVAVIPFHFGDFETKKQATECAKLLHYSETLIADAIPDASLLANDSIKNRLQQLGIQGLNASTPIKLVLLADDDKISAASVRKVRKYLSETEADAKPHHLGITYALVIADDLEGAILETESPRPYVDSASINIDKADNICHFGDEDSMVVNISAKSVRELYEHYHYAGLFAQNLRYYVRMPNVDTPIQETIATCPDKFWYFNNGIIIICDNYQILPNSEEIKLSNFSIINGGQTTKLIGESEFTTDFFLLCKIIKNNSTDTNERLSFISTVAEASNRQKPIKSEDLISNKPVHRILKQQLADVNVFCRIKRGERTNKKAYPESWQNITNKELAQLLMAFMYQEPGLVRNSASTVFTKRCTDLVFDSKIKSSTDSYSSEMLIDLLKFNSYLEEWSGFIKSHDGDQDKKSLVANSNLFMTALFGLIVKYWCNRGLIGEIDDCQGTENIAHTIRQYDIGQRLFNTGLSEQKKLVHKLLELLCRDILLPAFKSYRQFSDKTIVPSNFTKSDKRYYSDVVRKAIEYFKVHPLTPDGTDELNTIAKELFHLVSQSELAHNKNLQKIYGINYGPLRKPEAKIKDKKVKEKAKKKLQKLRKVTANKHGIKVNDVFTSQMLNKLVTLAPCTEDELKFIGFEDTYGIKDKIFDVSNTSIASTSL